MASFTASSTENSDQGSFSAQDQPKPLHSQSSSGSPLALLLMLLRQTPTGSTHRKEGSQRSQSWPVRSLTQLRSYLKHSRILSTTSTLLNPNVSSPTISQPPHFASYLVRSETSSIPTLSWPANFVFSLLPRQCAKR